MIWSAEQGGRRPALMGFVVCVCTMLGLFSTSTSVTAQPITRLTAAISAPRPAEGSAAAPLTVELTQTPYLVGLSCPTASVCFTAGGGVVGSTTDGGRSWAVHTVIAKTHTADAEIADLSDISCPTVSVCYAVIATGGGSGLLVKTINGWRTWAQELPIRFTPLLSSIACPSASTCFVVSSGGPPAVFATTNGGVSWAQGGLPLPANSYSLPIHFVLQRTDVPCDGSARNQGNYRAYD